MYDNGHALPHIQRSQARNLRLFHKALAQFLEVRRLQKCEFEHSNLVPIPDTPFDFQI